MARKLTRIDRNWLGVAGIGLAVVLFLAVNLLAGAYLTSTRLDLTQDRLFTLSDGTREVLASIDEPVDLRLYYTKQLDELGPYFSGHAERVEELLASYRRLSRGKLRLERLDPAPFSPEEDLAVAEGLEGLPIKDDGTLAYFGLTGRNSTDDTQAIRYLAPERANFLEYDLTRMISDLAHPTKPVVAVLGDLPLMGSQFNRYQPWKVLDAMFQVFDVRFLGGQQAKIDDDVQVLMLAQPHNVDPATLYAIDQFVMRGGRVLAFVDPLAEAMAAGGGMNPMANPEGDAIKALEPLLAGWGVSIPNGKVVGDRVAAQRVTAVLNGRQVVVDYLPWLALGHDQLAANDVVTGQLKRLHLNSTGSIAKREGATTTIEPLVVSSPLAMEIDAEKIKTEPDPARLITEFVAAGSPFTLAARVTGPVKSAYPDGPPEGVKSEVPQLKEAKQPLNLILIADADLLADFDLGKLPEPARSGGRRADRQQRRLRGQCARPSDRQPGVDQPARARPDRPAVRGRARDGAGRRGPVPGQGAGAAGQDRRDPEQDPLAPGRGAAKQRHPDRGAAAGDRELPRRDDQAAPGVAWRAAVAARGRRASVDLGQGRQHLGGAGADRADRAGGRGLPAPAQRAQRGRGLIGRPGGAKP